MRQAIRIILSGLVALIIVVAAAAIFLAAANSALPRASADPAQLSQLDLARLAEFAHLQRELGDTVWPGYGDQPIPVVLYNEATVFAAGLGNPPDGWRTVPGDRRVGGAWQPAADSGPGGMPIYQQPLPSSGETPQAFTVRVGDAYAASLATEEWMRIALVNQIRDELPPAVAAVFPYRLFTGQLVSSTDHYLSLIAHEAFHAYQAGVAPARLAQAEAALRAEDGYPWDDETLQAAWQAELDLLAEALAAGSPDETAALAADILALRADRRAKANLTAGQIDLERQREWLEGLARYVELGIWRAAANTPGYAPDDAILGDPDFAAYADYDQRWQREIGQLRRMAGDPGEGRFYYTGMALATLLDRLDPGWQTTALEPGVFLEDLLAEALAGR